MSYWDRYCVLFIVSVVLYCESCLSETTEEAVKVVGPPFVGKEREDILVFYSYAETMNVLNHNLYKDVQGVKALLLDFENHCQLSKQEQEYLDVMKQSNVKRKPLIVVEGTHFITRRTVASKLATRMGAVYMHHPPDCLKSYVGTFLDNMVVKKAFYSLSLYAMAINATRLLYNDTVIVGGFWHDQAAYAIARSYAELKDMPGPEDPIYSWPTDLIRPDVVFFINSPNSRAVKQRTRNVLINTRVEEAYRRMRNPSVFEIKDVHHHDQIRYEMEVYLQKHYKNDYPSILKRSRVEIKPVRTKQNKTSNATSTTIKPKVID